MTNTDMPTSYTPLKTLKICSNTLSGGGKLVAIGDNTPLLIGDGETPKVWLKAIADAQSNTFISIVEDSVSKHPNVKILNKDGLLTVKVANVIVLEVTKTGEGEATADKLDLRPIGLNIFGDSNTLNVSGNSFSRSSMSGGGTLIGFGS